MKNFSICLILFLFIAPECLFSQSFAPPGAVWHYRFKPFLFEPVEEVIEVRAKQDTLIQGKTCRWLELTQKPYYLHTQSGIAVYEEGSKIFFAEDTSFYLLYDFALNEGDSFTSRLTVAFDSSNQTGAVQAVTALISVDSVKTIVVDGQMRKLQYTSSEIFGFGGLVLEGVGGLKWLFPRVGYPSSEYSEILEIICYKDGGIGYGDTTSCLTSSILPVWQHGVSAPFPNPSDGRFFWQVPSKKLISVIVFNALGTLVAYHSTVPQVFDLHTLPAGRYVLKANYADGKSITAQVVLH